jgi:hypothetical protein
MRSLSTLYQPSVSMKAFVKKCGCGLNSAFQGSVISPPIERVDAAAKLQAVSRNHPVEVHSLVPHASYANTRPENAQDAEVYSSLRKDT